MMISITLRRISLIGVCVLSLSAVVFTTSRASAPAPAADAQFAVIKQYCGGCHNDRMKAGGASFEGITAASIGQRGAVFEKAVRKRRGRVMRPPSARQPD